jgi:hypothetical protein
MAISSRHDVDVTPGIAGLISNIIAICTDYPISPRTQHVSKNTLRPSSMGPYLRELLNGQLPGFSEKMPTCCAHITKSQIYVD